MNEPFDNNVYDKVCPCYAYLTVKSVDRGRCVINSLSAPLNYLFYLLCMHMRSFMKLSFCVYVTFICASKHTSFSYSSDINTCQQCCTTAYY